MFIFIVTKKDSRKNKDGKKLFSTKALKVKCRLSAFRVHFKGKYTVIVFYANDKIRTFHILFSIAIKVCSSIKSYGGFESLVYSFAAIDAQTITFRELCHKLVCKYNFANISGFNLKLKFYSGYFLSRFWSYSIVGGTIVSTVMRLRINDANDVVVLQSKVIKTIFYYS